MVWNLPGPAEVMKKVQDTYFKKAKKENYPARSVYKLKEMDKKFHLLGPGLKVLDLGAAPGSWTSYAASKTGEQGLVLAVDLHELQISFPDHVLFVQGDIFDEESEARLMIQKHAPYDLVLSDMAPKTTGVRFTDQARSFHLAMEALLLGEKFLKPQGALVVKILEGPDIQDLQKRMRSDFGRVKHFKPKSSRSESREIFLTGQEFKGRGQSLQADMQ